IAVNQCGLGGFPHEQLVNPKGLVGFHGSRFNGGHPRNALPQQRANAVREASPKEIPEGLPQPINFLSPN
ncbi:MAG: hypothetical protein ACRC2S_10420, partial [Waterburya sp.]